MYKELLKKYASDMKVYKDREGKVVDVRHTPEAYDETRNFRRGVGTGLGVLAGGTIGGFAADEISDSHYAPAAGILGGATLGGLTGFGIAEKTLPKAIERERQQNLNRERRKARLKKLRAKKRGR